MAKQTSRALRLDEAGASRPVKKLQKSAPISRWMRWGTVVFWYLAVVLLMAPYGYFKTWNARVGDPSPGKIEAPATGLKVLDRQATEEARQGLLRKKKAVYIYDPVEIVNSATQKLNGFLKLMAQRNPGTPDELSEFNRDLRRQFDIAIDDNEISQFLPDRLAGNRISQAMLRDGLYDVINITLNKRMIVGQKADYLSHEGSQAVRLMNKAGDTQPPPDPLYVLDWPEDTQAYLLNRALPEYFTGNSLLPLRQAAADLLMQLIRPNLKFDPERTEEEYARQLRTLEQDPLVREFQPGEQIAEKGKPLTPLQVDALDQLNAVRRASSAKKMLGLLLIIGVFFAATAVYLRRFQKDLMLDASTITLHALPPVIALVIGQLFMLLPDPQLGRLLFPASLVGTLLALLITPRVAFVLVLTTACLFGIGTGQDFIFLVIALFGGYTAIIMSSRVRTRMNVIQLGLQVGLVNLVTLVILSLIVSAKFPDRWSLACVFSNGLFFSWLGWILISLFEDLFGIVTDQRLLELTGGKHELLRQLEEKSPGTYQHVLNVTKLAEAAAEAIDANYLLVRAGAMFHDVGKMVKPKYYSENQVTLDDKKAHSRLTPYMSVLIIKNHVKEGIELARKARPKLPQKVIDFIPQHHGTGLISFFYSDALKRYENSEAMDPVHEEDFRYPGPKPQSVETAIVLLADSAEATAASKFTSSQVNINELRRVVQETISQKFLDGQFEECDLTLRHLFLIREAFVRTLMARYHFRIQYPTLPRRETTRDPRELSATTPIAIAGPAGPA